jgi:alpha-N-arabinofuranosidase
VLCALEVAEPESASGRVFTADVMTAHNTFENPEVVKPAAFNDFQLEGNVLTTMVPSKSVVVLAIK